MNVMFTRWLAFVLWFTISCGEVVDYWDDDWDTEKNCEFEEEVWNLVKKEEPEVCVTFMDDEDKIAIERCKSKLADLLDKACVYSKPVQPGQLLYCKKRATTTCCFKEHKCEESWTERIKSHTETAVSFMKDPITSMELYRKERNYDTCHYLNSSYDASVCEKECRIDPNSKLSKFCSNKNGLMKCCIRRDKFACNSCRFCCTLHFCTYIKDKEIVSIDASFVEKDETERIPGNQDNVLQAINILKTHEMFWKAAAADGRCLKPDPEKDPTQLDAYHPDDFYAASSQLELEKARIIKYDKRYANFEDPEILERLTSDISQWKEAYGFDFVAKVPVPYNISERMSTTCSKYCMKAEREEFATECRAKGGFFKCCINIPQALVYEQTEKTLVKEGLISKATDICGNKTYEACGICYASESCTTKDLNGEVTQEYKNPNFNPVGGKVINNQRYPAKSIFCNQQDFCDTLDLIYDPEPYAMASSWEEFCKLKLIIVEDEFLNSSIFKNRVFYPITACLRDRSLVRMCPKKKLKKLNNSYLNAVNKELREEKEKLDKTYEKPRVKRKKKRVRRKKKKDNKKRKKKKKKSRKKGKKEKRKKSSEGSSEGSTETSASKSS